MSSRFEVTEVEPEAEEPQVTFEGPHNGSPQARGTGTSGEGVDERKMNYLTLDDPNVARNQLSVTSGNLALYEDDLQTRPRIAQLLSSLVPVDGTAPNMDSKQKGKKRKKKANLGVIMGVYLPTLQNILGVILFLRLPWIVGIAGVGFAFLIILLCCTATLLTAISLSAIATNGHVPAGGSYFMISRNLGPEFGGAVGVLFYLATTFAAALYVVGAIEILLTYIVPQASIFGTISGNPSILFNNIRVYGTVLLILLSLVVFVGVKIVNWFATVCLIAVLIAVASIYAGAFNPTPRAFVCTVDDIALRGPLSCDDEAMDFAFNFNYNISTNDSSNIDINEVCSQYNPKLRRDFNNTFFFRFDPTDPTNDEFEGPDVGNWTNGSVTPNCIDGIPGLTRSRTIVENTPASYLENGEVRPGVQGTPPQVTAEITTSFLVLIGIFFPSVTGIMAGSNRSGDLKDAQKSIPIGTIAAILTTSLIYITCVLFFGATIRGLLLRDQYGYAAGLTVSLLAWPSKWVILIGALFSTIGAGLQSLTGAPRLLQAIANDNLLSFLSFFKRTGLNGEPSFALFLTVCLSEIGVLIASLDLVAPILTMFFLICYMFVNFACFLQSLLKAPNWRPRFRFYHWSTSLIGALLCLILMFLVSWYYALVALVLAAIIYKYIEYRRAEKEWGDGVRGLQLQAALYALLKLEDAPVHTKNWRPQLLLLCKLDQNLLPAHPKMLSFASQLKAGHGLMMVYSVMEGKYTDITAECIAAHQGLKRFSDENKVEGFCKVVAATTTMDGISQIIQSAGLGGMKHNTVVINWPDNWRKKTSWHMFIEALRIVSLKELAVLVPKGINWFPSNIDRMKGNIDIWWVVHDGGLLMLLPFLLLKHKVWRHCHLRIFTVAQLEDNSIQMKKDLAAFLYQLRIPAEVDVIEMPDNDISAYTYERTLVMEQRNELLKKMRLTERQKRGDVQHMLSRSFSRKAFQVPTTPLSPPGEISIPVPQFPNVQQSPLQGQNADTPKSPETVSIGELSIEPRVAGPSSTALSDMASLSPTQGQSPLQDELRPPDHSPTPLLDLSTPTPPLPTLEAINPTIDKAITLEFEDGVLHPQTPPRGTPPRGDNLTRRTRKDSSSSSGSSCPEEEAVRTPLLEEPEVTDAPSALPTNTQPSIKRYDEMFVDEVPLGATADSLGSQPNEENLLRMNTSVKLNELIVNKSHSSALVVVNLPGPPKRSEDEENYMEFLDVLTEGLERVLMVRGGGREVITIYS